VRSVWKPDSMNLNSTELFNPNDNSSVRIWTFMAGTENPTIFSARYVREDEPGRAGREGVHVTILPMTWTQPGIRASIIRPVVSPGTDLDAVDQKTDRMHIAYLTVDDPGKPTRGQLMTAPGLDRTWDRPVEWMISVTFLTGL